MSEFKGTPGPWTNGGQAQIALTFDKEANIFPPSAGPGEYQYGGPVAVVAVDEDAGGEANANLIAAAPELLAACEAAEKAMAKAVAIRVQLTGIKTGANADTLIQIRAAIAKAKGD